MMACRFEYNGKTYDQDGLAKALENMPPHEAHKYIEGVQNIPNAPFKKSWDELALKRALTEAVKGNYDALSWTPGEAQAARYDLSKHVDKVNLVPQGQGLSLHGEPQYKYRIDAFKDNHKVIEHFAKDENEVASVVGKEVAQKLFETRNQHGASTLAGQDLKIGGEGMKAFYDKMLVQKAENIVKKMGGKVEKQYVEGNHDASLNQPFESRSKAEDVLSRGGEIYAVDKSGEHQVTSIKHLKELEEEGYGPFTSYILGDKQPKQEIWAIKITPQMREKIKNEGFPLFTAPTYIPIDNDPFEKKLTKVEHNPFKMTPVNHTPEFE